MEYTIDSIIRPDILICQPKKGGFRFGCDSLILANFAKLKKGSSVADAGSGSGIIAVLAAKFYNVKVTALEIQPEMYQCLLKSIELSMLPDSIYPVLSNIDKYRAEKKFDAVICNPPYRKEGSGHTSISEVERIARFSVEMDIRLLVKFCKRNLKHGGKLFFSYDADMLVDAIGACRDGNIEPKRLRLVHPAPDKAAKLALIEAVFGAGEELLIEPPLYQKGPGEITADYEHIFNGGWK